MPTSIRVGEGSVLGYGQLQSGNSLLFGKTVAVTDWRTSVCFYLAPIILKENIVYLRWIYLSGIHMYTIQKQFISNTGKYQYNCFVFCFVYVYNVLV